MSLFLAGYLPRAQSTAAVFKDYGISGLAPCPVSQAQASAIPYKPTSVLREKLGNLSAYICAFLTKTNASLAEIRPAFKLSSATPKYFTAPPLAVTFPSAKMGENVQNELEVLGFSKQSQNARLIYYKGTANDTNVKKAVALGADPEGFSPFGCVNVTGFMCWSIINRVIWATLLSLQSVGQPGNLQPDGTVDYSKLQPHSTLYTSLSDLKEVIGIYIPYFHGLNTVDKTIGFDFVLTHAFSCLGANPKEIVLTGQTMSSGWHSLSATPEGMVLAHILRCLQLAISLGKEVKLLMFENRYHGCIIVGEQAVIMRGKDKFVSCPVYELVAQHHKHDNSLSEIAEKLSCINPDASKEAEVITASMIVNPRTLHGFIRARTLTPEIKDDIRKLVKDLKFSTDVWEVTDADKTALAIEHIVKNRFLPADAPMAYKTEALYTKEPIYSTLAAFGLRAPSLIGLGNNLHIPVTKGDFFKSLPKNVSFKGIPIFYKPIQQAYEDWKDLIAKGVLTYKSGGQAKDGTTRLPGVNAFCDFDTQAAKRIRAALSENISQTAREDKKRKDRQEQVEGSTESSDKAKRSKISKNVNEGEAYLALLGGGVNPTTMDTADDDFDF